MLSIEGGFYIDFDQVAYTKTLDRIMGQIIREAARNWLRAVLTSVPEREGFPVLTGAAKSTLSPLGRMLRVAVPVIPVARPSRQYFDKRRGKTYTRKSETTIVDRRAEGQASQQFLLISNNFNYTFEWSTDLLHYFINEYFGRIPFAPWHTLEKGARAFADYANNAILTRLPNLAGFIEVRVPNA